MKKTITIIIAITALFLINSCFNTEAENSKSGVKVNVSYAMKSSGSRAINQVKLIIIQTSDNSTIFNENLDIVDSKVYAEIELDYGTYNFRIEMYESGMLLYEGENNNINISSPTTNVNITMNSVPQSIIRLEGDLNFGDVIVNDTVTRNMYIHNDGNKELTVTGYNISAVDFSADWQGTIPGGGDQLVVVTFNPQIVKEYDCTILVESDATSGDNSIDAYGNAVSETTPVIITNVTALEFNDVPVNTPATMEFDINGKNLVDDIHIQTPLGFKVSLNSNSDFVNSLDLAPTDGNIPFTTIYVRFIPTEENVYTGYIECGSMDAESKNVEVSGAGVVESVPTIITNVSLLEFNDVPVNTPATMEFDINGKNLVDDIHIQAPVNFQVSLNNSSDFVNSLDLAPTDGNIPFTTIYVRFIPTEENVYTGYIECGSMDAESKNVEVSGAGVVESVPTIITNVTALEFNDVPVNTPAVMEFDITGKNLNDDIHIQAPVNFQVSLSNNSGFSAGLDISNTDGNIPFTTIFVKFIPTAETAYTGYIECTSTDAEPKNVEVSGAGVVITSLIEIIQVEGGTFLMGDHFNEGDDDELPTHEVTLSSFQIGKYEVTQAQYEEVMGENPSYFIGENKPAEQVSWYDVLVFCNRLSIREGLTPCYSINGSITPAEWGDVPTGQNTDWDNVICNWQANGYRLPTEAEWEYAARGGVHHTDNYKYAGTTDNLGDYAWYSSNSGSTTHEVGTKLPNQLGIYDMSGNVWEWCNDWYGSYSGDSQTNPVGPSSGSYRVLRGGSWYFNAIVTRVVNRSSGYPPSVPGVNLGFRVLRTAE